MNVQIALEKLRPADEAYFWLPAAIQEAWILSESIRALGGVTDVLALSLDPWKAAHEDIADSLVIQL